MSGHCHDEHDHSGHSHSHGDEHDHSDDITPALQYSLYQHINFDDITTLNESEAGSGKAIVKKTWAERLQDEPELESDADEQLLMHIPFVLLSPLLACADLSQFHRPSQAPLNPNSHIKLLLRAPNTENFHQP
jgi:hypothetical protein